MASASVDEQEALQGVTRGNIDGNENLNDNFTPEQLEDDSETSSSQWNEYSVGNSQALDDPRRSSFLENFESEEEPRKQVEVVGTRLIKGNHRIYLAKLPSTIGVEPCAFQKSDELEKETERESTVKIRYRKVGNNWESNTRLVKWEDGTSSLFIGNECFDVTEQDISGENQLFLFRRQPTAQVAECRISRKLKIQPASVSLGLQHKLGTYERFAKERKVKMAEMDKAPELEEQKLAQLEHERARAQARLEAKRRRKEQLLMENWRNSGISNEFLDSDYSSNESGEEDPSFSIANVKSRISGKSNEMITKDTEETEADTNLLSKAQMERENPSRLDKLKDSDTPLGTHRESLNSEDVVQRVEAGPLLDVERRHHKVFMLSDEESSEDEENESNHWEETLESRNTNLEEDEK